MIWKYMSKRLVTSGSYKDFVKGALSRDSMVMLKKKLLEMQKGMEFLTYKEKDYEELQQLAEEEAETICELEKENFKLKHALNNIEDKISSEKEKYMKLAEYEAETICNLEKENYELINTLNVAEENLQKEQTNNKLLQESWQFKHNLILLYKLYQGFLERNKAIGGQTERGIKRKS